MVGSGEVLHTLGRFTLKISKTGQVLGMFIKFMAVTAVVCAFLLAPSAALSTGQKGSAVLPASGVWLRVPVIPWPNWKAGHRGLDIQAPIDTEVFAPTNGQVTWVGRIGKSFGITIDAGSLIKHTIMGIDSPLKVGKKVWRGQFVGWAISNQHCENLDCIHWSVRQNGRYIDPRWLLKPIVYRLPKKN